MRGAIVPGRAQLLAILLIAGAMLGFASSARADTLIDNWDVAPGGCSGCHGTPVTSDGTTTTRTANSSAAYYFILNSSALSVGNSAANVTADMKDVAGGYCARSTASGGGSGTYMCSTAGLRSTLITIDDDVSAYLLAARQTLFSTKTVTTFPLTARNADSAEQTFTIRNYRSTAIDFTPSSNSSEFIVAVKSPCTTRLPAASSTTPGTCTVGVTFHPSASTTTRLHSSTIDVSFSVPSPPASTFTSTAPSTQSVNVSGIANVPPVITIGANKTTIIGTPVTLSGNSVADANVTSGDVTSATLSYAWTVLAKPSSASAPTLTNPTSLNGATFTPDLVGSYTLQLAVSDGVNAVVTQTLTVTANPVPVASITAAPTTLDFLTVQQNVTSAPQTVTITNTGTAPLVFVTPVPNDPLALSGTGASDYTVTGCTAPVAPSPPGPNTCVLSIVFKPSQTVQLNALLTIKSNASNGDVTVMLKGMGTLLPNPMVTGPGSNFPDTVIGETSSQTRTITIFNARTRAVTYTIAAIPDFRIASDPCAGTVPGGNGSCVVTLEFKPTLGAGEGQRNGTYHVDLSGTLGDADPTDVDVPVSGKALLPLQLVNSLNVSAVVGSPTVSSVLLTNRSATSITLSNLAFTSGTTGDYAIGAFGAPPVCSSGLVLAGSSFCTLYVRFDPAAPGTRNATLTVTHTGLGSPQTIQYLGTATPAPQGQIALGSTNVAFSPTQLLSSSSINVLVQNTGNLALTFSAFTFGGANPGDFTRSGTCSTTTPLAAPVPPATSSCTLTLTFTPTQLGARSANLTIASDASNGSAVLTLTGTGVPIPAPQVSFSPPTLDFGVQTLGGLYPTRRIQIVNSGTADLHIASVVVGGAGFANVSAAPCLPTLVPLAACDVDVAFAPTTAASYAGTLTVADDAAGSPQVASLSGVGTAAAAAVLQWTPAVSILEFGPAMVGGPTPAAQRLTLQNAGPGGVTLTVLNAVGPDAAAFSVVGVSCQLDMPLFAGQTCTIDVRFAPGSAGLKTAMIQVASSGSFPPVVTLQGTGTAGQNPSFDVSAASIAFATTRVGAMSLPSTLSLVSSGSGAVGVSALEVSGPYVLLGSTCPPVPFSLPAGTECTVSVAFKPTDSGAASGTLHVTTDAAPSGRDVALSGSGEAAPDVGGGGCSISSSTDPTDPVLWLLVAAAALMLLARRRNARNTGGGRP